MGILRLGGGGMLLIALALNVVALATPGWIYVPTFSAGLFKSIDNSGTVTDREYMAIFYSFFTNYAKVNGPL